MNRNGWDGKDGVQGYEGTRECERARGSARGKQASPVTFSES